MSDTHQHDYGESTDLLPGARENGLRELADRLTALRASVCAGCGEIAIEAERQSETRLSRPDWRGIEQLAIQTVGEGVLLP